MHSEECRVPEEDGLLSRLLPAAAPRLLIHYRLFVLASVVMKSWARLRKEELLAKTERLHDPFPFALWPNRECAVLSFCLIWYSPGGLCEPHRATLGWFQRPALPKAVFAHLLHIQYIIYVSLLMTLRVQYIQFTHIYVFIFWAVIIWYPNIST